jgi:hypothetical protein
VPEAKTTRLLGNPDGGRPLVDALILREFRIKKMSARRVS